MISGRSSTAARFTPICGPESRTFKQLDYSNDLILFYFIFHCSCFIRDTALIHKMVSVVRLAEQIVRVKGGLMLLIGNVSACPRAQARSRGYLCLRPA